MYLKILSPGFERRDCLLLCKRPLLWGSNNVLPFYMNSCIVGTLSTSQLLIQLYSRRLKVMSHDLVLVLLKLQDFQFFMNVSTLIEDCKREFAYRCHHTKQE